MHLLGAPSVQCVLLADSQPSAAALVKCALTAICSSWQCLVHRLQRRLLAEADSTRGTIYDTSTTRPVAAACAASAMRDSLQLLAAAVAQRVVRVPMPCVAVAQVCWQRFLRRAMLRSSPRSLPAWRTPRIVSGRLRCTLWQRSLRRAMPRPSLRTLPAWRIPTKGSGELWCTLWQRLREGRCPGLHCGHCPDGAPRFGYR